MIQLREDTSPLALSGLTVAYGDTPVLWNVTWRAEPGRRVAIVGPNGAGKTTLLEAALGLVRPLSGEARFWGQPLARVRDRVAYVPQREAVDWDFPITALEVAAMGASFKGRGPLQQLGRWLGASGAAVERRAQRALDEVGLQGLEDRPIGQLSGGQQQRVFLARALARDADLVLLDEPFAAVDATTEAVLLERFEALSSAGCTLICVHHDLDTARDRFDDALVVNRELIASGPVADALDPSVLAKAYGAAAATV